MNIENDVREVKWAFDIFQRKCVPPRYWSDMDVIIARYYMSHPSKDTVDKIVSETTERIKKNLVRYLQKKKTNVQIDSTFIFAD